jgi:hypothetical protein
VIARSLVFLFIFIFAMRLAGWLAGCMACLSRFGQDQV